MWRKAYKAYNFLHDRCWREKENQNAGRSLIKKLKYISATVLHGKYMAAVSNSRTWCIFTQISNIFKISKISKISHNFPLLVCA